jgi:hypothetical protein
VPASQRSQVTYKGISAETQAAVREAARAAGMTMGAWVEKALLYTANNPTIVTSGGNIPQTIVDRLSSCETVVRLLLEDYYERHPDARSQPQTTHTRRIVEALSGR